MGSGGRSRAWRDPYSVVERKERVRLDIHACPRLIWQNLAFIVVDYPKLAIFTDFGQNSRG
jgi:hypothetical protein